MCAIDVRHAKHRIVSNRAQRLDGVDRMGLTAPREKTYSHRVWSHIEKRETVSLRHGRDVLERDGPPAASAFSRRLRSRVIGEHVAHRLRGDVKEVQSALGAERVRVDQAQERLVDQRGRLTCGQPDARPSPPR